MQYISIISSVESYFPLNEIHIAILSSMETSKLAITITLPSYIVHLLITEIAL